MKKPCEGFLESLACTECGAKPMRLMWLTETHYPELIWYSGHVKCANGHGWSQGLADREECMRVSTLTKGMARIKRVDINYEP